MFCCDSLNWDGVLFMGTETLRMQLCRDIIQWFPDFHEQFKSLFDSNIYIRNICRIKVAKARRWVRSGQWTDNEAHISSNSIWEAPGKLLPNTQVQVYPPLMEVFDSTLRTSDTVAFQIQIFLIKVIFSRNLLEVVS